MVDGDVLQFGVFAWSCGSHQEELVAPPAPLRENVRGRLARRGEEPSERLTIGGHRGSARGSASGSQAAQPFCHTPTEEIFTATPEVRRRPEAASERRSTGREPARKRYCD